MLTNTEEMKMNRLRSKFRNDPDYGDYLYEQEKDRRADELAEEEARKRVAAAPGFYLNQAVPQKVVAQILHDMHGKTGPVKLVDGNKVINDLVKQIKGEE